MNIVWSGIEIGTNQLLQQKTPNQKNLLQYTDEQRILNTIERINLL